MSKQNTIEHLSDLIERKLITADEANVLHVLSKRVLVVTNGMPRDVRKALNSAVDSGRLGRMKKDGMKPEVYFHPNFKYLANEIREKEKIEKLNKLANATKIIVQPCEES